MKSFYSASHIFSLPEQSSGRAIALPSALALALALAKCYSFYVLSFLCDGQGGDRRAILSSDRSCFQQKNGEFISCI